MQKIINGCAIFSGIVSIAVVGAGGYLYLNKDSIVEDIKGKAIEAVMGNIGGLGGAGLGGSLPIGTPDLQSPVDSAAVPEAPSAVVPSAGLGVPTF